jgi:hypothetical protein
VLLLHFPSQLDATEHVPQRNNEIYRQEHKFDGSKNIAVEVNNLNETKNQNYLRTD